MLLSVSTAGRPVESVELESGTHVLGRSRDCQVVIDDPSVSSRHAQIEVAEGGAWISDVGSTNGTFIGSHRVVERTWLADRGSFQVGYTSVQLLARDTTSVMSSPVASHAAASVAAVSSQPPPPPPPPPGPQVFGAGPVSGGDVVITGGRDAAGRDLVINEGFKLQSKMRSSAKQCIRAGCVLFLVGVCLVGYFVITWNNQIFEAVRVGGTTPPDLPSPLPWLPLGFLLAFSGIVLAVVGLLIPRDRVATRKMRE
jgi:hypothetical protein